MRTSNPVLSDNAFDVPGWEYLAGKDAASTSMTIQGTVNAAFILIMLTTGSAIGAWYLIQNNIVSASLLLFPGMIGGLVLALIMTFSKKSSVFLAPVYAVVKGGFLGAISLLVESQVQARLGPAGAGIVFQAVLLTFGIFISLLMAYKFGLVRVGHTLGTCVMVGTAGVMMLYLVNLVMHMVGWGGLGFIHGSGWMGIGFSLLVVVLASLNLVMDFQFVESAAQRGSPKYMEWYAAFGVLATLVWLYIEI
ncbi:MAG TPA: Bax inhibitor-1/YccA family protein, partial [Phycisphaerales bacterium]|nr:Bax inhibitor-1/YccA family protein [Phycisphaerales bacterium]